MKKFIAVLISVLMICAILSVFIMLYKPGFLKKLPDNRSWTGTTDIRITPVSFNVRTDTDLTINIQVNTGSNQINGASLKLKFPPKLIEAISIQPNPRVFTPDTNFSTGTNLMDNNRGEIDYMFYTIDGSAQSLKTSDPWITIATVNFRTKSPGTGIVTFSNPISLIAANDTGNVLRNGSNSRTKISVSVPK